MVANIAGMMGAGFGIGGEVRMIRHPSGRPIRRPEVKKLSIIRNPGTGPLLQRLREPTMQGPIGFTTPDVWDRRPGETPEEHHKRLQETYR
jgi:hypothetical protein